MGLLAGVVVGGLAYALVTFVGPLTWVLILVSALALVGLGLIVKFGHRGFGGRGNTDLNLYITVLVIVAVVLVPTFTAG